MRDVSLWNEVLGVEKTVFESVEYDQEQDLLVARVRPTKRARGRCGLCLRPCPGYDGGDGRRRWRALDLGTVKAVLEADAPRVSCRRHGVVVAAVPWARHGTGHTYAFDDTVAWLTVRCSKTAVRELMRVAWRMVGSIITRVSADAMARTDRFANLTRIGIDEISYKRGHFSGDPKLSLSVSFGANDRGCCQSFCLACATWLSVSHTKVANHGEDAASRAERHPRVLDRCRRRLGAGSDGRRLPAPSAVAAWANNSATTCSLTLTGQPSRRAPPPPPSG